MIKANAVGRQRPKTQAEMIENIRSYLRSRQLRPAATAGHCQPNIVRRFFHEKHVLYAAV